MKKGMVLILLGLLLASALASCSLLVADTRDVWDGRIATGFAGGEGTESNPHKIKTCAQLAYLADQVNLGTVYSGKHFSIQNDLDLNHIDWTPIGIWDLSDLTNPHIINR